MISSNDLLNRLVSDSPPLVVDVCIDADVAADPFLIPSARRLPHPVLRELPDTGQDIVLICQKGLKLSVGGAALLRARGMRALALTGGNFAWRDLGLPRVALDCPMRQSDFVAAEGSHTLRLSAWLIRRFVQPGAQILWVPDEMTVDVAERFDTSVLPAPQEIMRYVSPLPDSLSDALSALVEPSMQRLLEGLPPEKSLSLFDAFWHGAQGKDQA